MVEQWLLRKRRWKRWKMENVLDSGRRMRVMNAVQRLPGSEAVRRAVQRRAGRFRRRGTQGQ